MQSHFDKDSKFRKIMADAKADWSNIVKAAEEARIQQKQINSILQGDEPLGNGDVSFVVFGSLAREEWTLNSDVDWTLLIDGQADPEHLIIAQSINDKLEKNKFREPGGAGVFGNLSFSHEIIHQIGGQSDTNRNTTQRILLLLESVPLGTHSEAFERVVNGVLARYVEENPSSQKLPRFLLNDIIRFWRTVAVDFASKQRDRAGRGWGLRNAKLRMSRKLIFTAGMLLCFESHLRADRGASDGQSIAEYLYNSCQTTPLEVVARACAGLGEEGIDIGGEIFSHYDHFLGILNDKEKRDSLDNLRAEESAGHTVFQDIRRIGHGFQAGLTNLLFSDKYGKLAKDYGVF